MTERKPLIAGNWKMHKTQAEARVLAREIHRGMSYGMHAEVMVAPPYTALATVAQELKDSPLRLGAQDTFWEKQGAFTGAVSAPMLRDAGCHYVIVGHSERRQHFGDTDDTVNRKLLAALAAGLVPVLCVGEVLEERRQGQTLARVAHQTQAGLAGVAGEDRSRVVIAYEPVWAIGTGLTATPGQAQEVQAFIRSLLRESLGEAAETTRILYGGSVTPENAASLLGEPDIDGALVGGASLKSDSFLNIIAAAG
jgi:triosephosphate isomerase